MDIQCYVITAVESESHPAGPLSLEFKRVQTSVKSSNGLLLPFPTRNAFSLLYVTYLSLFKLSFTNFSHYIAQGYSHGSLIASQHPPFTASLASPSESSTISNSNPIPTAHILLSYPLSPLPFLTLFHTRTYRSALTALIQSPDSRVLVLFGDRDEFTSGENYETWSEELQREMHVAGMEHHNIEANRKLCIVRVEGANHFWAHGKLAEMCESIEQWVDDLENP